MDTEFWLKNWQQNKIGFHQQQINNHLISFWPHAQIKPNAQVFVPLCGKSLDLLWLRKGHSVIGVEISELAVNALFFENGLSFTHAKQNNFQCWQTEYLTVLQGDFFNLTPNHVQAVAGIFDRAALVALPVALRQQYAQHLKSILPNSAKMLLVTFEYEQAEMAGPPFSVNEAEVRALYQDNYAIEPLFAQDVLDSYPPFRALGLTHLHERVYLLKPY
jgi:thiopurine S-methyltransferase